jgi:outer membrane protein assembly factor BamB
MSAVPKTTAKSGDEKSQRPGWSGSFWPPISVVLAICLLLAVIPLVQTYVEEIEATVGMFDGAVANIVSLIASFLAFMVAYIWLCWFSGFTFRARRMAFAIPLALVALALALLRFEGVDGYMKPTFAFRWTPRRSNNLDVAASRPSIPGAGQQSTNIQNGAPSAPTESSSFPTNSQAQAQPSTVDLATETPNDFPQFLGPARNNWLPEASFAASWDAKPPREVWRKPIGPGWSGFAVRNGFAVTLEQRGPDEWVSCYRVADGELMWHHAYPARHNNPLGGLGPRAVPTIDQGKVYSQGATGVVCCLDGATGNMLWQDDLLARYGMSQSRSEQLVQWGRSGSPLIVDNMVIVPAGGDGEGKVRSLIAYDKESGNVVWEAGDDQISYASPILADIAGVKQVVSVNETTLAGYDPRDGRRLWTHEWHGNSSGDANVSQPFAVGTDQLFISKGYGLGCTLLKLTPEGDQFSVEVIWESRRSLKTKFTNVAIVGSHAYGLNDGILECVDIETGKSKWKSGRYGHGQVLAIGDQLLVLGESGELVLIAANSAKAEVRGKIQALTGKTWNNLCVTGNLLLVRNGEEAACYELP